MMHWAHSKNTSISRSLLAGLACGIIAAILNVGYMYFYRKATGFTGVGLFEPLFFFIAFPLLFIIAGFIFFEMIEYIKRGRMVFTFLFLLLTLMATISDLNSFGKAKEEFLLGIILITGILISLLLPFLATHAKIFMDEEELSEST